MAKHQIGRGCRRPLHFTDAEIRRMVDRRADGVTLEAIARAFGTSANKVRQLVRQATASQGAGGPSPV